MKRLIYILLCCLSVLIARADETIVVGDIESAETGEVISNASVYFMGTKLGTTSNEEGSFVLRADLTRRHTLVVSAVGYRTERFTIEPGTMAGVQVVLHEQTSLLSEVIATPGINPAIALIQGVREARERNDRRLLGLETEAHKSTELYISGITRRHLQKRLWKSLEQGMLPTTDSTYLLPLYSSEHGAIIMSETDYESLITDDGDLNFYEPTISLMNRSFLSPLARSASTYYNYYLIDSIPSSQSTSSEATSSAPGATSSSSAASSKQYLIDFRTKNPFYETLNGTLTIDSATLAITAVTAEVPEQTSVNFLRGARIHQTYAPNHALASEDIDIVLDFAVKLDHSRTFPTVLLRHTLSTPSSEAPSSATPSSSSAASSSAATSSAIGASSSDEVATSSAFATLDSLPVVRFAHWMASIINTGYIPTGTYVDIGHIQEILQVNRTEGVHVGLPFRTSERLMKNVALEAAVGYGFRNQQFTGLGRVSAVLPARRRHLLTAEYRDHLVWPEVSELSRMCYENNVGYRTMDFTAYAFEALYTNAAARNTLLRKRQFEIATENDWSNNVETRLYLQIGNMGFRYQTLGGIVRLGWGERKIDLFMRRIHQSGPYPTLYLQAELGSWSPFNSEAVQQRSAQPSYQLYGRLGLMLRQNLSLGLGGRLDYALSAGYVIGNVPDLLLHHFEGNQTYAYDPYRFTLMNNGQYTSRGYVSLHTTWNGQGILFNLIPGIRYLRLRELVTFKLAYPIPSTPYIELGCGIGNILRVLELHSVWRLTNRHEPGAPLWALRFRFNIEL